MEFNRLDDAAESWGIIVAMWVSALCVGFPAPLGVGEFGGVTAGRSIGVSSDITGILAQMIDDPSTCPLPYYRAPNTDD